MRTRKTQREWPISKAAMLVLIGVMALGCSGQAFRTAEVTGTITSNGKPVPGILVMFAPPGGSAQGLPPAYGVTDATGRYRVMRPKGKSGAVVGLNDVALSLADGDVDRPAGVSAKKLTTQRWSFDVKPGRNAFDISLAD